MQERDDARLRLLLAVSPGLEEELALLDRFVGPGDVCVDIGASYGTYTVPLARLTSPGGWVHAFEPRPRSRAVLAGAVAALTGGNVTVHPVALADRDGVEAIVTPRRRWLLPVPGRTFLKGALDDGYYDDFAGEFGGAVERTIDVRTLDDLVRDGRVARVDLVKIDVEGAELRVCRGAAETLARFRPVVVCEVEDRHTRKYGHGAEDVLAWFGDRGYRPHVLRSGELQPTDAVALDRNNHILLPV